MKSKNSTPSKVPAKPGKTPAMIPAPTKAIPSKKMGGSKKGC